MFSNSSLHYGWWPWLSGNHQWHSDLNQYWWIGVRLSCLQWDLCAQWLDYNINNNINNKKHIKMNGNTNWNKVGSPMTLFTPHRVTFSVSWSYIELTASIRCLIFFEKTIQFKNFDSFLVWIESKNDNIVQFQIIIWVDYIAQGYQQQSWNLSYLRLVYLSEFGHQKSKI